MTGLHAWVDESGSDWSRDPNTYILAAALCADSAVEDVQAVMRPLRRRGTSKLHWRDETDPARRMAITETVAGCTGLQHVIVVRVGITGESRRRPRHVALKQLLMRLDELQVSRAVLESRGPADDGRDVELFRHLRDRQQVIGGRLQMHHAPGRTDEGLWVADAVCGVVSASRTGQQQYLKILQDRVTLIVVDRDGDISR